MNLTNDKIKQLKTEAYASLLKTNTLTELIVDAYQRRPNSGKRTLQEAVNINIRLLGDPFSATDIGKTSQLVNANIEVYIDNESLFVTNPISLNGSGVGVMGAIADALKNGVSTKSDTLDDYDYMNDSKKEDMSVKQALAEKLIPNFSFN